MHGLSRTESREEIFNYFAEQVFMNAKPETRDALIRTAYMPRISARAAESITGNPDAATLIDELYRRRLFTYRRGGQQISYQYHDLFREFLRTQAEQTYTPKGLAELRQRSAMLLVADEQVEEAFKLYCEAQDWEAATVLALQEAKQLISQGRWKVTLDWIDALPKTLVTTNAWLLHWRGMALLAGNPAESRASLESAYRLAAHHRDELCEIETVAAIIESYLLEYSYFTPLDGWTPVLRNALEKAFPFPTKETELRVQIAFLNALTVRPVALERLPVTILRVFELLTDVGDVGLKVGAARTLVLVAAHTGQLEVGARAERLLTPLLDHPSLSPYARAMCLFVLSWYSVQAHQLDQGMRYIIQSEQLAKDEEMPALARLAHYMAGYIEIWRGHFTAAWKRAELMEKTMFADHPFDVASNWLLKGNIAIFSGDPQTAIKYGRQATELYDRLGSRMHRVAARGVLVSGYSKLGDIEKTRECLRDVEAVSAEVGYEEITSLTVRVTEAHFTLKQGDVQAATSLLRQALTLSRQKSYGCWLKWSLAVHPELCELSLQAGIEVDYVRHLIRECSWQPSSAAEVEWPWRVKIYTLGRFEVLRDDLPIEFSRKQPKRVLALLKAIIASGGRDVSESRLTDALWPGEDGDNAHKSFEIAVRRLRALLGGDELVEVVGNLVSLNSKCCWLDTRAFDELLLNRDVQSLPTIEHALNLYKGNFLPNETAEPWSVSMRERMRGKFIRFLSNFGKQLERSGEFLQAIPFYQRGIETDDLAEEFYQGLMRCYLALDRRAEGMSVFRRLRQTLSVTLGLGPSASSDALAQQLRVNEGTN